MRKYIVGTIDAVIRQKIRPVKLLVIIITDLEWLWILTIIYRTVTAAISL